MHSSLSVSILHGIFLINKNTAHAVRRSAVGKAITSLYKKHIMRDHSVRLILSFFFFFFFLEGGLRGGGENFSFV